ncbi:MAG: cobalt ECF transporter T component CbiQ [Actinobacteria bacterium]|nr:cobalt ECF transporter T component CbiQ [Actinomycetota bacterium]
MGAGHAHALYVHEHSAVHRLAPEAKLAAALSFIAAVAVTPREAVWAFGLYALVLALVLAAARVPPRFLFLRLLGILPFVAFAFLIPFVATGDRVEVLGIEVSGEGLWGAWNILAKATLGAATSIGLAATTEVPKLIEGLGALKVPAVLVSIAAFMIRYLELIAEELGRMRMAMAARGYDPHWLGQVKPIAAAAGAMFVRSYERGERVHSAMLARGYSGVMPVLRPAGAGWFDWLLAMTLPLTGVVIAAVALVVT